MIEVVSVVFLTDANYIQNTSIPIYGLPAFWCPISSCLHKENKKEIINITESKTTCSGCVFFYVIRHPLQRFQIHILR